MFDTDDDILMLLRQLPGREGGRQFSELYARREFSAYRTTPDGRIQEVCIEVFDSGAAVHKRYHVHAKADDGAIVHGNPDWTLAGAIAVVDWGGLDKPPDGG